MMLNTLYKFQELHFWSEAMSWITQSCSSPALCHQQSKLLRSFCKMPIRGVIGYNQRGRLQNSGKGRDALMCGWSSVSSSSVSSPQTSSQNPHTVPEQIQCSCYTNRALRQVPISGPDCCPRKSLQYWNPFTKSLERHLSQYPKLPTW